MLKKNFTQIFNNSFDCWIFDLDNTIYDIRLGLFKKISERITKYIIQKFNVPFKEALKIQREFYQKYGLTLRGLILEKKIDPHDFLKFVHDVSHPELKKDLDLKKLLTKIQGDRYIFTNASHNHANKILTILGIKNLFKEILDIEKINFIPKPNPKSYEIMKEKFCIDNKKIKKTVFIEDTVKNLKPAKIMGMTTVWIENDLNLEDFKKSISYVDYSFKNIKSFLRFIN